MTMDQIRDLPTEWPILKHEVLARGHISDFARDTVATPQQVPMVREYTMHPGAVGVIALDEEDRVVVVRQYRHPVGYTLVEPPAGLLDADGETFLAAAQRELAEEAQLAADDWRILVDFFTTPGNCEESIRMYLARGLRPMSRPDGFELEGEEANMVIDRIPFLDLVDAVFAGRCQNPSLVVGILALYGARMSGRMDTLRPADSPWPARDVWSRRYPEERGK